MTKTFRPPGGPGDPRGSSPTPNGRTAIHRRWHNGRKWPASPSITGAPVQIYRFEQFELSGIR